MQSCARGRRTRGLVWVLGGLRGGMWQPCGAAVRGEGTHGKHESLWGGCSTNAGDTYGRHVSVGVSAPLCVEEGRSSLGQPGIVMICWSSECHRQQCGWGEPGHGCLRALLTHGITKGDKDKIWKMQRGNGRGQDPLFLLYPLCRH